MNESDFSRDVDRCRADVRWHRVFGLVLSVVTLGFFRNRDGIERAERKLEDAANQLATYRTLLQRGRSLDAFDEEFETDDVRVSDFLPSELPVVGPQEYGIEWEAVRQHILARDGHKCQEEDASCSGPLQVHHIQFLSRGGTNDESNLTILCRYHHSLRHEHMRGSSHHGSLWI